MSALASILDVVVIGLLAATLPMAWRLDRMLRSLRADRAALEGGAVELGRAARETEALLARLREAAEQAQRQTTERVKAAELSRDDLRYLIERAEAIADRLESAVQAGRAATAAPAPASLPRSEAERELLRALGRVS
jgi:hypothetical protein